MKFADLASLLPPETLSLVMPLHQVARDAGCTYRIDQALVGQTLVYSAKNYRIEIKQNMVCFAGEFDIRSFMKLFRETPSVTVRELLFRNVQSCSYCINDKCTTFLMAKHRTIELQGVSKTLCGPYRHHLEIRVTPEDLPAALDIAEMFFRDIRPHMHTDFLPSNEVTYSLVGREDLYICGYMARHTGLSREDQELVDAVLAEDSEGRRRVDLILETLGQVDTGEYVGAIDKFMNGSNYEFIFGVLTDKTPSELPEGMVSRKVRGGEWAVYNTTAGDYPSIWRHFTNEFYNAEKRGFDPSRIPFEFYDRTGRFYDVHVPIDVDMPADSGKTVSMYYLPNTTLAGYSIYAETDYPLYKDLDFRPTQRLETLFPNAEIHVHLAIHATFGRPIRHDVGVMIDDTTPIPEGVERVELKGGYWILEGRRHFNGEACGYPFDTPMNFRMPINGIHHPRGWLSLVYKQARGGYQELGNPARIMGQRIYTVVDLPPQRVIGKLEDPPDSVLTDEEKLDLYTLPENKEQGSYVIGYTLTSPSNAGVFYDKPLIKGVLVDPYTTAPSGLKEFVLEGGKYLRVTEDIPNGEPGWEIEFLLGSIGECTEQTLELERQFIIKQNDFGKSYEFYMPIS